MSEVDGLTNYFSKYEIVVIYFEGLEGYIKLYQSTKLDSAAKRYTPQHRNKNVELLKVSIDKHERDQ